MNKTSKLLLGLAALSLAACSNDEPANVGGGEAPHGDVAYLNIRIASADNAYSRAAQDEFLYGDGDENEVKNAYFYFYDKDGNYVLESNTWIGGTNNSENPDGNVEIFGNNTVILTGLTDKGYPNWVVTVLNRPSQFNVPQTLDGWLTRTRNYREDNGFIMTTSSYFGEDNKEGDKWHYFATKLNEKNFLQELPDKVPADENTRVQIYVERLAARVGVDISGIAKNAKSTITNGYTYFDEDGKELKADLYELDITVAGEENPELGDDAAVAATKVFVAITGWDLATTVKSSTLVKSLEDWTDKTTFGTWAWNQPDYHRSYWGKSYVYGKDDIDADLNTNKSWNNLSKAVGTERFKGDRAYCNENTNTPDNIESEAVPGAILPSMATSVMLRAVICTEATNEEGKIIYPELTTVNFLGVNWTEKAFINKVLSLAEANQFFYLEGEEYKPFTAAEVELARNYDQGTGCVKVVTKSNKQYYKDLVKNEDGSVTATPVSASTINAALKAITNDNNKATAASEGAMFYTIPLAHLNNDGTSDIVEGEYGVVRNHVYNLAVSKIKSLGDFIFEPNDPIKPEEPKDPTFYVESTINILSWKVVDQEVEI
ncbi:MAG: fimbria major subunit [Bacteroidales bacterium]|nr:fimbria major subunit [Bacteroidales bacterium]